MTLYDFIMNETGKKHLIPGQDEVYRGQCVQLIGIYTKQMFNEDLPVHPNAKDYWTYGIPGWDKVSSPQEGDIAVYNGHGNFPEGHIAIYYAGGAVFEENADPDGSPAHLFNRNNTYLLGYLRKQGGTMDVPNDGDIINAKRFSTGVPDYQPTGEEFRFFKDPVNGWKALLYDTIDGGKVQVENAKKTKYEKVPFPVFKEK